MHIIKPLYYIVCYCLVGLCIALAKNHALLKTYLSLFAFMAITAHLVWLIRAKDPSLLSVRGFRLLQNLFLVFYICTTFFLVMEEIMILLPRSHSVGYTHAMRFWLGKYVTFNRYGYRDRDVDAASIKNKKTIVCLGDSVTWGHGIKNIDDRFSGVLQKQLGSEYVVYNISSPGADTAAEYQFLTGFSHKPDLVVLQYFENDIIDVALSMGNALPDFTPYSNVPKFVEHIIKASYTLDYLYWSLPQKEYLDIYHATKAAYRDPRVFARHQEDLARFVGYSKKQKVPLIVVVIPFLNDMAGEAEFVNQIGGYFRTHGIPVVDVSALASHISARDLVVNVNDLHPSVLVHELIGNTLYKMIHDGNML